MKTVHVAVGVVQNAEGKVLIAKRADHQHQGGLWEFPGGKVESGESVLQALIREFSEEVDLTLKTAEPLLTVNHDYSDKKVLLDVWLSRDFRGVAKGNEQQLIAWVAIDELDNYPVPAANQDIIAVLKNL